MSPDEVKRKAEQINSISMDYHLSHAVFACNKITEGEFKQLITEKITDLKDRLRAAEKNEASEELIAQITKDIDRLGTPYRIYVEYFNDDDMNGGRVVYLPESNQFVISLPETLLCQSRNDDGSYNAQGVKKLRWMTAHELGHIALQTKELLEVQGTQGSKELTKEGQEEEADLFAKELLSLRYKRNKHIYQSEMWKSF